MPEKIPTQDSLGYGLNGIAAAFGGSPCDICVVFNKECSLGYAADAIKSMALKYFKQQNIAPLLELSECPNHPIYLLRIEADGKRSDYRIFEEEAIPRGYRIVPADEADLNNNPYPIHAIFSASDLNS
jgi:hypothetical protein